MERQMQLMWETYFEEYKSKDLVDNGFNPLRNYESEFTDGPIIDIGCGQSNILLEYAAAGKTVIGIDNEELQLNWLKNRLESYSSYGTQNCTLLNQEFPIQPIPEYDYSVIVLNNFLHFFSLPDASQIISELVKYCRKGTFLLVSVHASEDNENLHPNYFKHIFSEQDLLKIFEPHDMEQVFLAQVKRRISLAEVRVWNKWIDKVCKEENINDPVEISDIKNNYYQQSSRLSDTIVIFKKS